ncbi:metallo-beta-lactamase family protein [Spiroplasma syrphidicola EA-1]|uniref:Ribonuclease J n=1 Tax=Spiroplasma syrphidicola EA-1 TaxID=1276229 RepID=R4U5N2_9MOLU|nr:ribonuclease J [Spiroplasma syrphidicola]AGM25913.1 metallo-beta-lactamase family protein [Spiroplasma syrphidicola EA-1]
MNNEQMNLKNPAVQANSDDSAPQQGKTVTPPNQEPTKVFALGGLEEIGKNTYCIEHQDELIMIDAGVKFPSSTMLGVDAVIPNYSYLKENQRKIKALFITHGHEDHIGGIPYLLREVNVPIIYAPRLAAALIRDRLKEAKLEQNTIVKEIDNMSVIKTKNFKINFFAVNHSIPDAFGVTVNSPNGRIVSTGDYKFDWTPLGHRADIERMANMGQEGVMLLMADSTNAEVEGYTQTETKIIKNIGELFVKAKGRILISTFASNVHRIQHIVEIANKYGRKILVFGRSLDRIIKIIRQMGHLKISDKAFIKANEAKNYKDSEILIICTGSQGEPMAALSRIANNQHQHISIIPGDTVIFSSSPIPGNQADVERVINKLVRAGAIVHENSPLNQIHTSGHASQEEQKLLFTLLKPKYFMPMHGDYRMLKQHGETAVSVNMKEENIFICANGDQIELLNGEAKIGKRIEAEAIYVDGKDLSGQTTAVVRDREILSKDGLIAVVISIDSQNNRLLSPPRIISRGSFYVKESGNIINESIRLTTEAINEVLKTQKPTFGALKSAIKQSLSPFIYRYKRRNPLIIPVILNKK